MIYNYNKNMIYYTGGTVVKDKTLIPYDGLWCTTANNMLKYLCNYDDIVKVEIPSDAIFQYINNIWQTDKYNIIETIPITQWKKWNDNKFCEMAVKINIYNLQFVKKQTEKICLYCVTIIGWSLQYIKKPSVDICMNAVKNYGKALQFVPIDLQTEDICIEAVKQDANALQFVNQQTEEICSLAADYSFEHGLHSIDSLIYASALLNSCKLITFDNDFRNLKDAEILKGENF